MKLQSKEKELKTFLPPVSVCRLSETGADFQIVSSTWRLAPHLLNLLQILCSILFHMKGVKRSFSWNAHLGSNSCNSNKAQAGAPFSRYPGTSDQFMLDIM